MTTVTKPAADEEVRVGLSSGDPDEPLKSHRVCPKCYPGAPMGSVALCGEKVLGIRLPKWYAFFGKSRCKTCTLRRAIRHLRNVHGGDAG